MSWLLSPETTSWIMPFHVLLLWAVASKYENLTVFHRMFSFSPNMWRSMMTCYYWTFFPDQSSIYCNSWRTRRNASWLKHFLVYNCRIHNMSFWHLIHLNCCWTQLAASSFMIIYVFMMLVKAVIISLALHTGPWPRVVEGSSLTVTSGDEQMHQQKETSCYHSGPAIEKTLLGAIYGCIKQINHELLDLVMPKLLQNGVQV